MQRLFSSFAEGWPGAGLLLQRVLTSSILMYYGTSHLFHASPAEMALYLIAIISGFFLFLGFLTPLAGIAITLVGVWVFFTCPVHPLAAIVVAVLGASVAMIGPGMWSIDARRYGRKHLEAPRR